MHKVLITLLTVSGLLFNVSCSSTGLEGSIPIPFTKPAANARPHIQVTPLPPKICFGIDVIAREDSAINVLEDIQVLEAVEVIAEEK
tara:strand:+ start:5842 stop:6102 length:261 start_codon:yes stop_codon:yes gene_type:complete